VIDGRKRIASVLATLCITALSGSVLTAGPSHADPDIPGVTQRVNTLYHEAEQASERFNVARDNLQHAQTRLHALDADLARQRGKVEAVRKEVAAAVIAQYQGQALSSTTQVLLSDDPDTFLDQLTTISEFNDQRSQMMAHFAVQAKQLEMRQQAAKRELAQIAETKKTLAAEKAQIDKKASAAKALLDRLKAEAAREAARKAAARQAAAAARAMQAAPVTQAASVTQVAPARASRDTTRSSSAAAPASGRAAAAVQFAMAQVGDAYVFGAAGPSAWDCSGLTMMAWAQAGVSLPHSSSGQMSYGTPVSQSQLQPGDLVFYYSPVSHVGMYIGNGKIVNALNPSAGVQVSALNSMPYSGAVRPG
jgi:cell wall-associated NlpC family hydrolase